VPRLYRSVRLDRRAFALAAISVLTVGGTTAARALAQQPGLELEGDCNDEPGVALLLDWQKEVLRMREDEILAPVGWQLFASPNTSLVLLIPPDWTAQFGWATQFTSKGAPILDTTPDPNAALQVARLLNRESTIAFDYASGILQGVALKPLEAAQIAIQAILGEDPDLDPICTSTLDDGFMQSWITAHRFKDSILVTSGQVIADATGFSPYTSITYQAFYGPRESFEQVVREIFIRFLYQQLQSGGSDPTPTPTPEF